jgi:acid phosphatase (class A)
VNLNQVFAVVLAAGSVTVFAHGQSTAPKPPLPATFRFLNPADVNPERLLPPPPKDGSEMQQREMAEVKRIIQTRTKERHDQAHWDASHEDPTPWQAAIGPEFDLKKLPATAKLLADVLNDQTVATSATKEFFKRKFPVAAAMPGDSYAEWSCDDVDRKPQARPLRSYPSGHATMGFTFGVVLASLIPEKSQAILARSSDYAYSREVCGDHYHSDVEAGHVLGTVLGTLLLQNAALKPELDAARQELQFAHITASSALPENYIQVNAPMAQRLTLAIKGEHPEIKKLGLHATPPSSTENAIIASETPSKIGKKSSDPDMKKVAAAKPTVERLEKDGVYDLFLPLTDAQGRDIGQGFVVMEVPFGNASNADQALMIGKKIRDEVQRKIPSRDALYQ